MWIRGKGEIHIPNRSRVGKNREKIKIFWQNSTRR